MPAVFEFLPERVEREHDAGGVFGLVKPAAPLFGGEFAESVLDEFLRSAGVKITVNAIEVLDARGRDTADEGVAFVLKLGFVDFQKPTIDAGFIHRLAADGIPGHIVPEVNHVREIVTLGVSIAEKVLEER